MRRTVIVSVAALVTAVLTGPSSAAPAVERLAAPLAGTSCEVFPADNYWHADVRTLPVHPLSGSGSRTCRPTATCTPTSATVRHPDHRRRRSTHEGPRDGSGTPTRATASRYPLGKDTRIEGGRGPTATGTPSSSTARPAACTRRATTARRRPVARRLRRDLAAARQRAAPGRLDVGRRGRTADPARAAALGRGARAAGSTTRSASRPTRPSRSTCGRPATTPARGDEPGLPADGRAVPPRPGLPDRGLRRRRAWSCRAMKTYGLVLADNGSPWFFQGERNRRWPDATAGRPQGRSRPPRSRRSTPPR